MFEYFGFIDFLKSTKIKQVNFRMTSGSDWIQKNKQTNFKSNSTEKNDQKWILKWGWNHSKYLTNFQPFEMPYQKTKTSQPKDLGSSSAFRMTRKLLFPSFHFHVKQVILLISCIGISKAFAELNHEFFPWWMDSQSSLISPIPSSPPSSIFISISISQLSVIVERVNHELAGVVDVEVLFTGSDIHRRVGSRFVQCSVFEGSLAGKI